MKYIDLGLPSGNLWCDCNYGTNYPTESGKYFTFEEVEGFMGNKEELIPTKDDFQELIDYCRWEWAIKGYKITGPNGNSIFLPAAGWRSGASLCYAGEYGSYWSSTPFESNTQGAYGLSFGSSSRGVYWYSRGSGRSVRRIKKVNKMKEVKIEIPKGYIIDEENSTLECIKFKKKEEININKCYNGVTIKTPDTEFILLDTYEVLTTWENAKKHCKKIHGKAELPNREQCSIIYKYKEVINKYLENKIEDSYYWTSEEKDSSSCWAVGMSDGGSYVNYRDSARRVRPIINM